ncbi:MAG: 16S rRNA (cytosine(967)-C(5))-methyltransferase RsmB [Betaproteobacteria bacterium]|nr:16S rRNA (cytosine(967)-C(5))-methyltransferase RsmB [Betaproteobacteria bacterium]MDE1956086.1 16S rRNA (cytosine(967)-C(5))-methyltransferase RsmB [Betaproteobacteria bacterium]
MKTQASDPGAPRALHQDLLAAAELLGCVLRGESLATALPRLGAADAARRGAAQALSFEALRGLGRARALLARMHPKALKPPQLEHLLLAALALLSLPEPRPYADHTLVFEAVQACAARPRTRAARGLVNALLRRFQAQRDELLREALAGDEARYNHPAWWIEALRGAWPQDWQRVLELAASPPPMTLRVNRRWGPREDYLRLLREAGLEAQAPEGPGLEQALVLERAVPVTRLPHFAQGAVSVQDASAQLAAVLLDPRAGMRVLDACAAPGGKTAHLLELADCELLALERDAQRAPRIGETLERLHLRGAELRVADAARPDTWWDGRGFDRILLDAPCSASGISRRHPDIRWLRKPTDIDALASQQRELLDALWPLLRPGGHLLYATCSVFPAEGAQQAASFLERHGDALALAAPGQILPGRSPERDGFYYALFAKRADAPA